jgi:hypothetical protein
MTCNFSEYLKIIHENYQKINKAIEDHSDGFTAMPVDFLKKEMGRKEAALDWGFKYALHAHDFWLNFAEWVPRKDRPLGKELLFWIRRIQPEDRLSSDLQTKTNNSIRCINAFRNKVGLLPLDTH